MANIIGIVIFATFNADTDTSPAPVIVVLVVVIVMMTTITTISALYAAIFSHERQQMHSFLITSQLFPSGEKVKPIDW